MRISDWSSDVCSSDLLNWHSRTLDWLTFRANYTWLKRTGSEYNYDPYEFTFSHSLPGYTGTHNAHTVSEPRTYDVGSRTPHTIELMAPFTLPHDMHPYPSARGHRNDHEPPPQRTT